MNPLNPSTAPAPWRRATIALALAAAASGVAAQDVPAPPAGRAVWPIDDGPPLRALAERHGIGIGHAMRYDWVSLDEREAYEDIVAREFGLVTPESSMKWDPLHPEIDEYDFTDLDRLNAFASEHDIALHGHPLVWYRLNPEWVDELPAGELADAMVSHIETVMGRWPGRYPVWDVVNEAVEDDGDGLRDNPFLEAMGPRYLDIAFAAARAADPGATLLYNDYDIGWPNEKNAAAFALLDELAERDVPVDGVGFQMHLDLDFAHAEGFSRTMQDAADRGLEVYITEFDVTVRGVADFDAQGQLYEDILERCLMQPACRAFQVWGLDDVHSFRPQFRPLPFDEDFRAKPAFFAMRRALETEPVHPELCALDGASVVSGAIVPAPAAGGATDGTVNGVATDAVATARCDGVRLGPGYAGLVVRYSNAGSADGRLDVRVAGTGEPVAGVALPPTSDTGDGAFATLRVPTLSMPVGAATLELELAGASLDALLFDAPAGPVVAGFGSGLTGEGTGVPGGAGTVRAAIGGGGALEGTSGGGLAAGGEAGVDTEVDSGNGLGGEGGTTAGAPVRGGRSGGGAPGGAMLLALAGVLGARARYRHHRPGRSGKAPTGC